MDHPRSRGVYPARVLAVAEIAGSSPLARGLLKRKHGEILLERIIPARAGFTGKVGHGTRPDPDHPRSRGVYYPLLSTEKVGRGSSPLARGLPVRGDPWRYARWIIPARAGFTG